MSSPQKFLLENVTGFLLMSPVVRPNRLSIVCKAALTKKADSAEKRARQNEKRRLRNKSRKSEVRTRMKKVTVHCWALPSKLSALSLNNPSSAHLKPTAAFSSLSLSASISHNVFSSGFLLMSPVVRPNHLSIVCKAALTKKADSAEKRARQNEKRRLRNKSRKSEVTCFNRVLKALELLRRKKNAKPIEVLPIEKLIAEAYSAIDKAVRKGVLHRNTGKRRKSRLARKKTAISIHHGWYTPAPPATV
ncbi:hypothetical protein RHSIM_Rhsim04G0022600 [Rhododendron simsii]|uniref:30S ribosomal protein S20, chloroplastic n=1 Tax=Rhododendron simsii TaxID=118357 RepID=A0A834HCG7_RHOSS|nr:hypothetical protein RHSIM_Rhsim04G0022600 [Rhododendron simsii]